MKVVIINGQNHKGSTYNIGRILANKLTDDENIKEFFLPRDLNHYCLGCYTCIENEEKCPFFSEKKIIIDALEEADVFVFTSPNYCLAPSGAMKSFLDFMFDSWMVHRPKEWMFRKRAVIISTSAGASNGSAVKVVKTSLFYWGIPEITTYGIAVQAMNWGMVSEKKKAKIESDMTHIATKLKRKADKKPRVGIKTKFIFKMMAGMHSAGWDSSPVEKKYWEERGWLGNDRPWKN